MRVPTPSSPLQVPWGLALSDSEKVEALADSIEAQFQLVDDPSDPAVMEMVNEVMLCVQVCPRKWTEINQSLGGPAGHKGTQGWQGSGSERYSEQGPNASTKARVNLSHESV
jgi:hypothetical protein